MQKGCTTLALKCTIPAFWSSNVGKWRCNLGLMFWVLVLCILSCVKCKSERFGLDLFVGACEICHLSSSDCRNDFEVCFHQVKSSSVCLLQFGSSLFSNFFSPLCLNLRRNFHVSRVSDWALWLSQLTKEFLGTHFSYLIIPHKRFASFHNLLLTS